MRELIKFLLKPLYKRYDNIAIRISNLEKALYFLVDQPKYIPSNAIGFNGQQFRKKIFCELLNLFNFDVIIETGTYIGQTTGYMREASNLPIITCEVDRCFHAIARSRLKDLNNITFKLDDSRKVLEELFTESFLYNNCFIYLDAHWYDDLPLKEEIALIGNNLKANSTIMIDDFKVPLDDGYKYDCYGKNRSLALECFSSNFLEFDFIPYFPVATSNEETGAKNGCVVLIHKNNVEKMNKSQYLQKFDLQK